MGMWRRRLVDGSYHYQIEWVDLDGKRRKKTISDRKLAEQELAKRQREVEKAKLLGLTLPERILFEDFCEEYLTWSKKNKSSWIRDRGIINNLLTHFKGKYLNEITLHLVEQYRMDRQDKVTKATTNREVACLKAMFNKALDWNKFKGENPVKKIKFYHEEPRIRYLTKPELIKFYEVLYDGNTLSTIKNMCLCAINTGLRRSEIFNLRWSNIDWQQKTLTIDSAYSKGKRTRIVDINEDLEVSLRSIVERSDCPYVFNHDGHKYTDIKKPWQRILKKAGINNFTFHDLRHTCGTYLRMKGVDLSTIAEMFGHQDIRTTTRYAHASREFKRQAVSYLTFVYPKVKKNLRGKNEVKRVKNSSNSLKLTATQKSEKHI